MAIDFGYPWWLSNGHLLVLIPAALLFGWAVVAHWASWINVILGLVTVWSVSAFALMHSTLNLAAEGTLPTEKFFASGKGRVLDIGAGTGRSSIMVLKARPQATLVASDLFGESFDEHFGAGQKPQDRLLANLKAAGVADRTSIETADMRKLPFEDASFDAVVSEYAMDHLNRSGSEQALVEAGRVHKPGGDFLLMLVSNDRWVKFVFGPALSHGGTRNAEWWLSRVENAGFHVAEQGRVPATLYILATRRQAGS